MAERIEAFRTSDGKVFTDRKEIVKYLDNQMGNIISLRAGQLAQIGKYSATIDFLLEHLEDFAKARKWQKEWEDAKTL